MNREIKFRGKSIKDKSWVYGNYHYSNDGRKHYILAREAFLNEDESNIYLYKEEVWLVDGDTVGQYTTLVDEKNNYIYEGDIVRVTDSNGNISALNSDTGLGEIEWSKSYGYWNISKIENSLGDIRDSFYVEVIGNIHDNKDLFK